eukprot:8941373-Alexandrium_andersonii.AAC.3
MSGPRCPWQGCLVSESRVDALGALAACLQRTSGADRGGGPGGGSSSSADHTFPSLPVLRGPFSPRSLFCLSGRCRLKCRASFEERLEVRCICLLYTSPSPRD